MYSPKVWAYIQTDDGIIELTDFIVKAQVTRRLNAVSSAKLVLRNPNFRFTKKLDSDKTVRPVFLPMDGITIFLQRLSGYPVQVFTGYLDSTPILQLYPGTVTIEASCTLKRLLQTYYDPNLFSTAQFLLSNGWVPSTQDGTAISKFDQLIFNNKQVKLPLDGSFSNLLYRVLHEIGNWAPHTINILPIPDSIIPAVAKLFTQIAQGQKEVSAEFQEFLRQLLGPGNFTGPLSGSLGSGGGSNSGSGGPAPANAPPGLAWNVIASQESTDLASNSGGGCGSHQTSASLDGWSELMNCNSMGGLPCDTQLWISANGKTIKANKVDCGGGSSYGAGQIVTTIGLYPRVSDYLGLSGGGPYHVTIWRVDGQAIHPSGGTPVTVSSPRQSTGVGTSPSVGGSSSSGRQRISANPGPAPQGVSAGGSVGPISPPSGSTHLLPGKDAGGTRTSTSLIVLHDSEIPCGPNALNTLYNVLDQQGLSVHAGVGCDGQTVRLADDNTKCYHVVSYNSISVGIEQIGFASQGSWPEAQLQTTAKWVAYWAVKYNIPIQSSTSHGVCQHKDLGAAGGGHDDCGRNYPIGHVLDLAKQYAAGHSVAAASGSTSAGGAVGGGTSTGIDLPTMIHDSKAVLFSTLIDFPTEAGIEEAQALTGKKGLMLDSPLLPFVEELCMATQRQFMSLPNGEFVAFFPDYFGGLSNRSPYWEIEDIEIMHDDGSNAYPSGTIYLSDDSLATHVYTVGDIVGYGQENTLDKILSTGVMDVGMAFAADFINGSYTYSNLSVNNSKTKVSQDTLSDLGAVPLARLSQVTALLKRYGARPYFEFASFIRSPYYETFYAYQKFMLLWAQQFTSTFTFTFMPELYPGGIVKLKKQGLQMYVQEVTHDCDFVGGFTTQATLIAPTDTLDSKHLNQGLLRPDVLTAQ